MQERTSLPGDTSKSWSQHYPFWCKGQKLPTRTLFRHRFSCLVLPRQNPKMNKIRRCFHRGYSVDLPLRRVSRLFCWGASPSVSARTGRAGCSPNVEAPNNPVVRVSPESRLTVWVSAPTDGAGCSPNVDAPNNPIVHFSPESWSTVCERQQRDFEIAD